MSELITILELYPQHLAINGDMGNARVLRRRLELAGFDVAHEYYNPGDAMPDGADIVTVGSGPVAALIALEADVRRIGAWLRETVDAGIPLLAIGGGYQLLGSEVVTPAGTIAGAGVFDMSTDATAERVVTNCFVVDAEMGRLIGIENHGSTTVLGTTQAAFGAAVNGRGNNGDGNEGATRLSAIGTHLHGPVLAMNPILADTMIGDAVARRGLHFATGDAHRELDAISRQTRALLADGHFSVERESAAR